MLFVLSDILRVSDCNFYSSGTSNLGAGDRHSSWKYRMVVVDCILITFYDCIIQQYVAAQPRYGMSSTCLVRDLPTDTGCQP